MNVNRMGNDAKDGGTGPEGSDFDSQYYFLAPDSLQARIALRQRRKMYEQFVELLGVDSETTILDVGVTSDRANPASNYLESWHPNPQRITALGYADASFLSAEYPGLNFVRGDGLMLPFADRSFDVAHCSAVIEHVGAAENQAKLIAECARVSRKGFFVATPYRWFPIEVHTSLPVLHWLPKELHRAILSRIGHDYYSLEQNLNLMDKRDFRRTTAALADFACETRTARLLGLPSNLLVLGRRGTGGAGPARSFPQRSGDPS